MPTKLFYIDKKNNKQINKKHKEIYTQEISRVQEKVDKQENSSAHDELINMILENNPEAREANGSLLGKHPSMPENNKLLISIETDDDDNIKKIRSQFGATDAYSLSETAKNNANNLLGLKPNNNNNNNNNNNQNIKPSEVSFSKEKDGYNDEELLIYETRYDDNYYRLTIDNHGHKIYTKQDRVDLQRYNRIDPQEVPPSVDNAFEKRINKEYKNKINNISDALNNDELWNANGKKLSSVPTKLLKMINSDNYNSPQEKYTALINEAKHQQSQKRNLATRWFKPKERPAQVTELLNNIVEGKDIDINELEELAERNRKNEYSNKEVENITSKYKNELKAQKGNEDMLYGDDKNNLFTL